MSILALAGCGTASNTGPVPGETGYVRGFLGQVAADEPRAAVVARDVLSAGGNAIDAAVAGGFALSVTLPSRAGIGGGGACLVFLPSRGVTESVTFPAGARASVPEGADRPAAVPMMARGLFALHTRGGKLPFEQLVIPAEQAARFGIDVSRALGADLAIAGVPLAADPWARLIFASPGGQPLAEGGRLVQPDLAATLATLRTAGVGDLHQGNLARRVEAVSAHAGAMLTVAEMRAAVPTIGEPLVTPGTSTGDSIAWLPNPGGTAAAAAFRALPGAATSGATLPASAGMLVVDRDGMAVSCAFSMNNLFGTGRVAQGLGFLFAAAPGVGQIQPPLLAAAIASNGPLRAFRAASVGTGQAGAPLGAAAPLAAALRGATATEALRGLPDPARGLVASCPRYLPGQSEQCTAAVDPRGFGVALGTLD
ncbi:gamma-glutamyltranspeptidase/glutathione hydrolase [Humitalea rosea]|uniref:Gamma-glutamyltranspeptidase/glutathione hydrolase n=1 Tax=Humitalea rosea TaxID=990373 RepID=A0A2W7IQY0_9PROT|nr:gamma-glutamyltranspeptidase/glutathione hydrolase [Humitalea rosea]